MKNRKGKTLVVLLDGLLQRNLNYVVTVTLAASHIYLVLQFQYNTNHKIRVSENIRLKE